MHVVRSPVARAAVAIEAAPGTVEHATRARKRVIPRPVRRPHTTVRLRIAFITGLSCAASVNPARARAADAFFTLKQPILTHLERITSACMH
eukprot:COSAG02_NODE_2124_length_9749_cov_7.636166_6_plen_92_part_00